MHYSLSKIAVVLLSPLGTALAFWLLILVAIWRGNRRLAIATGLLSIAWLWMWATPAASDALVQYVEAAHPPVQMHAVPSAQALVVLGGAVSPASQWREHPDLGDAADRIWHAARLWKAGKAPILLLSGGSEPGQGHTSEAQAMRVLLHDLGVPDAALVLEERSRTTRENAMYSAALLRARGITTIILVTSGSHMQRAMAHFHAEGLEVIPASTDLQAGAVHITHPVLRWMPDAGALSVSSRALKEVVGQVLSP